LGVIRLAKETVKKPFYKKWWVWVLAIIIIGGALGGGGEEPTETASTEPKEEVKAETTDTEKKEEPKKEPKKAFAVGDEVTVGKITYTVNGVEETETISSVLGDKTTEGKFAIVDLAIKNGDKEARFIDGEMFRIKTADGTEYSSDVELDMYVNDGGVGFFLEEINPNLSKSGKIVFELPKEATEYSLQVSSGFGWSGGKYENIKLK
jgi:hypothetical protein